MKTTLILVVTHHGLSAETRDCIAATNCPSQFVLGGEANICKARSIAFDQALLATEGTPIDTVLCVDDDMVWKPDDAQRLVDLSRAARWPVSAIALTRHGTIAAEPAAATPPPEGVTLLDAQGRPPRRRQLWYTGLAFMAVPRASLVEVAAELDADSPRLNGIRTWCLTGEHPFFPGVWTGEDLWFCSHFGGVELAPIGVGHLKWIPLWPDEATITAVAGTSEN